MKVKWHLWLPIALMLVFALSRWPGLMPLNFSAAYGLAFCAGVYLPGRLGWWLPLVTLLVTDTLITLYYQMSPFSAFTLVNFLAYAAIIWLGRRFNSKTRWIHLVGGGLLGAIIFYLVTNTFSWLQNPQYPKTLAGWIQALTVGTPGWPHTWEFFRNTLLSGGLFAGLFAGSMKLSEAAEEREEEESPIEEPEPEESKA